jgi:hypothetical protein
MIKKAPSITVINISGRIDFKNISLIRLKEITNIFHLGLNLIERL